MPSLSIIVPAFNEESHIESVVQSLFLAREFIIKKTNLQQVEVIVVDDGSTDQTSSRLKHLQDLYGTHSFKRIHHGVNLGYGAALKTGFQAASGDYLSFMDADGTLAPNSFAEMFQSLQSHEADMVIGKRFGLGDSQMPWIRKIGNQFFAFLLSFLSGEKVGDTASGMRLFRREVLNQLYPLPDGLHFTPAMSSKAVHEKLKIVEVPISYEERRGKSKLRVVSDGLKFLKIIFQTVLMYNPFKVFLLVGIFFEIIAFALLSGLCFGFLFREHVQFGDYIYRSIGALYFFVVGIQIVLFGVLARFMVSIFFKRHETEPWIHRLNDRIRIYDRMGLYGLVIFCFGILINGLYFGTYIFEGGLNLHWSWLLFAAGFIIVGIQMMITRVVMRILMDIRDTLSSR